MTSKMENLYVWVTQYPDGSIGNIGTMLSGQHMPLITRTPDVANGLWREIAMAHKRMTGQRCWLRTYHTYDEEELLTSEVN